MDQSKKNLPWLIIVLLIIVILIGVVVNNLQGNVIDQSNDKIILLEQANNNCQTEVIAYDDFVDLVDEDGDGNYLVFGYKRSFDIEAGGKLFYYSPLNRDELPALDSFLLSKKTLDFLAENGEVLSNYYAPFKPLDPFVADSVLLSTYKIDKNDPDDQWITNKIYMYSIETGELQVFYEKQNKTGNIMNLVGVDGQKIVFIYQPLGYSPYPCSNDWSDPELFKYYDLIDSEEKIQNYQLPEFLIDRGEDMKKACHEHMSSVN